MFDWLTSILGLFRHTPTASAVAAPVAAPVAVTPVGIMGVVKKGVMPAAYTAALTSSTALAALIALEANILTVYPDRLANNLPTQCAGDTSWGYKVGTVRSEAYCEDVNKRTLLTYGKAVWDCTNPYSMTIPRLIGLTLFAINVGKAGACNSSAVKAINRGNIKAGCDLIAFKPDGSPNWSYASGKYIPGLFKRRKVERDFCLTGLS